MRKALMRLNGRRLRFTAQFERFGQKNGYKGPEETVLLTDVCLETGEQVTDHIWFVCGKTFDLLNLKAGCRIAFDARVGEYEKGYRGRRAEESGAAWSEIDYRLERPTKAILV